RSQTYGVWPNPITWDLRDVKRKWSLYASYSATNVAPIVPTSLLTEGQTNPTGVLDTTPEFSAIYNDLDSGDNSLFYQVQVSTSTSYWSNLMWDSGKTGMATTTQGTRSPDISYAGTSLPLNGSTYYWRIRFWDALGAQGAFSTSVASFTMVDNSPPT